MGKSIKWRLVAIYVVLVIIVMLMAGTLVVFSTFRSEYDNMREELVTAAHVIGTAVQPEGSLFQIETDIQAIISAFGNTYTDKIIYLINAEGNVIFPRAALDFERYMYSPQIQSALVGQSISELDSILMEGEAYKYRGYAKPIFIDNQVAYVVYVMKSTETVETTIEKIINSILYAVLLSIVIASVLGLIFSNFITKPITQLSNQARLMAAGNLNSSIEVHSTDEIGELTRNFNMMAQSLNETLGEISSEKNKLEIVFSQITDGILVFDNKGHLTRHNPAANRMLHIKEHDDFEGVFSFYIEETFEAIYFSIQESVIQRLIHKSDYYYNVCFGKYVGQTRSNSGMICVLQDITEHKKLEIMQKEFVANVSHELRTPLTTIKSYTETLLEGAVSDDELSRKFLAVIHHEGDRMTALVQDLLELSKLDNQQTKFDMVEQNLNQLVADSVDKYQIHAQEKKQSLTFYPPKHQLKVLGDAYRIEQVLKNIISNAIKYSGEGSVVDVTLTEDIRHIIIVVEDTGMGISKEDLGRIFDRFYRVDKARARELGGTGLGLAIAKEIMEYHGGTIELESTLGEGSSFYLIFPKISTRG